MGFADAGLHRMLTDFARLMGQRYLMYVNSPALFVAYRPAIKTIVGASFDIGFHWLILQKQRLMQADR